MKHIQLLILCCLVSSLSAQITVGNQSFPQVGDTLFTGTDNMPNNIQIGAVGPDRVWNFKSLQAPVVLRAVIRSAAEGSAAADFPEANLVFKLNDNAEGYYKVTESTLELVGLAGTDPLNLGINVSPALQESQIERRAPLNYGDTFDSTTKLTYGVAAEDIPQELLKDLPITPDSIRIRLVINRRDEVDAWGTMSIPGGTYDVLREKRTLDQDVRLDAKVGFLGWQDITDIVLGLTDIGADVLGNNQVVRYYFWNDVVKEPIAVATMNLADASFVTVVDFKAEDILSSSVQVADQLQAGVLAYPNPAMTFTNFQFTRLKPGNYNLVIYNLVGSEVWRKHYRINGSHSEKEDISILKKGAYLYALQDERGKTLITRRLIVVRP